jgi:hypothetical protein
VEYLVSLGVPPAMLTAAAAGAFDPLAAEGHAENRRVELVLMPVPRDAEPIPAPASQPAPPPIAPPSTSPPHVSPL